MDIEGGQVSSGAIMFPLMHVHPKEPKNKKTAVLTHVKDYLKTHVVQRQHSQTLEVKMTPGHTPTYICPRAYNYWPPLSDTSDMN